MKTLEAVASILSIVALIGEVWTILYLCSDKVRGLRTASSFSFALVSSNFLSSDTANGSLYSFFLAIIAVPRLLVLYLPKLRPLLLHAALLHVMSAGYHFHLASQVWIGSLGDRFYSFIILVLAILYLMRYLTLSLAASKTDITRQEKREADLKKIRLSRMQYKEAKQRSAALSEASVLSFN